MRAFICMALSHKGKALASNDAIGGSKGLSVVHVITT